MKMANTPVRQYIGARYVPLFANPAEWDNTQTYEPLTIVIHAGNSYTSRQYVPVGIDITNNDFWALTGNYNAQVEAYRQEAQRALSLAQTNKSDIADINTNITDINTNITDIDATLTALGVENVEKATNAANKWNRFTQLFATPEDYGAVGDGITDDTTAIQNAINKNNFILFSPKTYITTSPLQIPSNKILFGFHQGVDTTGTIIRNNSTAMLEMQQDSIYAGRQTTRSTTIHGIRFIGVNTNDFMISNTQTLTLTNITLDNIDICVFNKICKGYILGSVFNKLRLQNLNTTGTIQGSDNYFTNWYYADFNTTETTDYAFNFNVLKLTHIENIYITGNVNGTTGAQTLLHFTACDHLYINNIICDYANKYAIETYLCNSLSINNINIRGCGKDGTALIKINSGNNITLDNIYVEAVHVGDEIPATTKLIQVNNTRIKINNIYSEIPINYNIINQYIYNTILRTMLNINADIEPSATKKFTFAKTHVFSNANTYIYNVIIPEYPTLQITREQDDTNIYITITNNTTETIPTNTKMLIGW